MAAPVNKSPRGAGPLEDSEYSKSESRRIAECLHLAALQDLLVRISLAGLELHDVEYNCACRAFALVIPDDTLCVDDRNVVSTVPFAC